MDSFDIHAGKIHTKKCHGEGTTHIQTGLATTGLTGPRGPSQRKLDGVGSVDNGPSINKMQPFVKKKHIQVTYAM